MAMVVIELTLRSAGTCQQRRYPWSTRDGLRPPGIALTCKLPSRAEHPPWLPPTRPLGEYLAWISPAKRFRRVLRGGRTTLVPGAARRFPLLFNATYVASAPRRRAVTSCSRCATRERSHFPPRADAARSSYRSSASARSAPSWFARFRLTGIRDRPVARPLPASSTCQMSTAIFSGGTIILPI